MPEIFRAFGFSFFFYSREHEPIHVHVEGKGGFAKYIWNNEKFVLSEKQGIKISDLKNIDMMIEENSDLILKAWNKHFNN